MQTQRQKHTEHRTQSQGLRSPPPLLHIGLYMNNDAFGRKLQSESRTMNSSYKVQAFKERALVKQNGRMHSEVAIRIRKSTWLGSSHKRVLWEVKQTTQKNGLC